MLFGRLLAQSGQSDRNARAAEFDVSFYAMQVLALAAGTLNITLLGLNLRDGVRMKGWLRRQPGASDGMSAFGP